MKKPRFAVVFLAASVAVLAIAAADILVVKIQATQLRRNPQFFAPGVLALKAGDKLEKVSESSGWIQVKTSAGLVGWVHSSAVGTSKFALAASGTNMKTQATASEVALAAKGFNKQVEDNYRAKHGEANFAAVDAMFLLKVSLAQIEDFFKKGRLGDFRGVK